MQDEERFIGVIADGDGEMDRGIAVLFQGVLDFFGVNDVWKVSWRIKRTIGGLLFVGLWDSNLAKSEISDLSHS